MTALGKLEVYVIGDPSRGIGPLLESDWLRDQPVHLVPDIRFRRNTIEWETHVDEATFLARHGRAPLEGEMGCAAAHLSAYHQFLETTAGWALVMESDALIENPYVLRDIVVSIIASVTSDGHVISLYSESPLSPKTAHSAGGLTRISLRIAPHGAVAYLLDRSAARKLIVAQNRIASVADWPVTTRDVKFSYVVNKAVWHDTGSKQSTVSPSFDRAELLSIRIRLSMWLGLWYLKHRHGFVNVRDYYHWVLQPRLHHILTASSKFRKVPAGL